MNKPAFWAVLPAHVRYNKDISDFAKILFAEITTLSNANGYCNACNKTLGEWYGKDPNTISRRISELKKAGLIKVNIIKKATGTFRKIYPVYNNEEGGIQKCVEGVRKNVEGGSTKMRTQKNNTSINNTSINKKGVPPSADDVFYKKLESLELPKSLEKFRAEISGCVEAGYLNYGKYSDFKIDKLIKAAYDILQNNGASKLKDCLKISTDNGWQSISIDYIKKSTSNKKTDGLNSLPVEQRQNGVAQAWKDQADDLGIEIFTL